MESTIAQYYIAAAALIILVLVFALYVYFFPTTVDFYDNYGDKYERLRSEPPQHS
jgi:hypothetical protein